MFEAIVLGTIQGIVEWLPVSSEGVLVLVQTNFFEQVGLVEAVQMALFLHLGTWLASVVYFRKDLVQLGRELFSYRIQSLSVKRTIHFYVVATLVSGILAFALLKMLVNIEQLSSAPGMIINGVVAVLLIVTGVMQLWKSSRGYRTELDVDVEEGIIAGIGQGLAALPGISRSGTTTAVLLLRKFREVDALRISFIMSIPIVLLGNIVLNLGSLHVDFPAIVGFTIAFVFGLITIHALLKIAQKVNFGWFVIAFAALLVVAMFVV
jgi:undecaprenyl-diphosphatase